MLSEFRTPFVDHDRIVSPSGDAIKEEFVGRYDKLGRIELISNGETDMYSFIQSHADSVDINVLMERYKNGDTAALQRVQGIYTDVTNMPRTMADLLNLVKDGEDTFKSLDVDVRAAFNHSLSEWLATAGSPEWFEKMGLSVSDDGEVIPSPVALSEPTPTVEEVSE